MEERQRVREKGGGAHSLSDVFGREVDDLLVHCPFLIALQDGFLKANTNSCITASQFEKLAY